MNTIVMKDLLFQMYWEFCFPRHQNSLHGVSLSWDVNNHWGGQEILSLFCNLIVHSKSIPNDPVLSHMNPVHTLTRYVPTIHRNIILGIIANSAKWSSAFTLPSQNFVCISPLLHACPSHPLWFNNLSDTSWGIKIMKLLLLNIVHIY
jgi:hypothetical protein